MQGEQSEREGLEDLSLRDGCRLPFPTPGADRTWGMPRIDGVSRADRRA